MCYLRKKIIKGINDYYWDARDYGHSPNKVFCCGNQWNVLQIHINPYKCFRTDKFVIPLYQIHKGSKKLFKDAFYCVRLELFYTKGFVLSNNTINDHDCSVLTIDLYDDSKILNNICYQYC